MSEESNQESFEERAKELGCDFVVETRTDDSKTWKIFADNVFVDSVTIEEDGNNIEMIKVETVNHPAHYNQVPGIECIDVVSHFDFVIGCILKYCWRAGNKFNTTKLEDLKKAKWYIEYAIEQEEKTE